MFDFFNELSQYYNQVVYWFNNIIGFAYNFIGDSQANLTAFVSLSDYLPAEMSWLVPCFASVALITFIRRCVKL